jgi:hypothetical protein
LNGNNDVDTIYGGSGSDTISGGNHADTIIGGWSVDTINVADANDIVKFVSVLDTGDQISGFGAGDKLDFSAIDAIAGAGDDAFTLTAGTSVVANGINYFNDGTDTTVWVDTDGNTATVEMEIKLLGFTGTLTSGTDVMV